MGHFSSYTGRPVTFILETELMTVSVYGVTVTKY